MSIRSVRGTAADVPSHRPNAVVPGTSVTNLRSNRFQAKLAVAGEQMQKSGANSVRGSSKRMAEGKPGEASREPSRPTAAPTTALRQAAGNRSVEIQSLAQPQRHIAPSQLSRQRRRQFQKATPKHLRDRLSRLATEFGFTVTDVFTDAANREVTLIVDESGYSRTRFVIECDDAAWTVGIHTQAASDADDLLSGAEELQRRFDKAGLGPVVVIRDPAT